MERLTWEHKDGGIFVDGKDIKIFEFDGVPVYTGNVIDKLGKYEDIGLEPEEILKARGIAMGYLKESLKENDRAMRKARMLGMDVTEIRQANAELERLLLLLSAGLNI